MATVAPSGDGNAPAVEVRDNGTIFNAGNVVATGPITSVVTLRDAADDVGDSFGSKVVANDGTGASTTDRVGVSGAFSNTPAYNASATEWIMKGGNVSTTIGGVANTVLASAGSEIAGAFTATRDNVNQLNSTRRLGTGGGTFDMFAVPSTEINPGFSKGANAGDAQNFVQADDGSTASADNAAAPTRTVPGELTYRFGAPNPTQDNYKAKDVRES
jgi:hypothetical protein